MRGGEESLTDKVKMSLGLKKKYSKCDDLVARTVLAVNEKHSKIIEKLTKTYQKSLERVTRKCDKRCRKMYRGSNNYDDDSDSSDDSDDLALMMAKLNPTGKAKGKQGYPQGYPTGYSKGKQGYLDQPNFPNWYHPNKLSRTSKVNSMYYGNDKTVDKLNVNFTIKTPDNKALSPSEAPKYIIEAIKHHINGFFEYLKKQIHVLNHTHPTIFYNRITSNMQVYRKDKASVDGYYRKYSITYPSVQYYKITLSSITEQY